MSPKVLFLDIETSPILAHVWKLFDNDVALNQVERDWEILSWAAKWQGDDNSKILVADQYELDCLGNDRPLVKLLHRLLKKADIIITHNGIRFDQKKINARFAFYGLAPLKHYRHIDTFQIAKKHFGFTSNKLEYLAKHLKTKVVKLTQREFSGFELWSECIKGNKRAWREMALYNALDVQVLEAVYEKLAPWDAKLNFEVYDDKSSLKCACGSKRVHRDGHMYSNNGKFQRFRCYDCGRQSRSKVNLLTKEKRKSVKVPL